MEVKKNKQADLEKERSTYFLLGLVVVLSIFFAALEWQSEEGLSADWEGFSRIYIEEELVAFDQTEEVASRKEITVDQTESQPSPGEYNPINEPFPLPTAETEEIDPEVIENELKEEIDEASLFDPEKMIHTQAEVMPQFPGGYDALVRYLFYNTEYPSEAVRQKLEAKVWASFVVNKEGSVSDVKIEITGYIYLDREAKRVLENMPDWIPGSIDGRPVSVKIFLPIVFKL